MSDSFGTEKQNRTTVSKISFINWSKASMVSGFSSDISWLYSIDSISPLYTWQDGRGAQPEFDGKSIVQEVYEKTGLTVSTGFGLVTHLYHCRKGIVPEGAVTFCSIGDYLGMKLTGRKTPLVHELCSLSKIRY